MQKRDKRQECYECYSKGYSIEKSTQIVGLSFNTVRQYFNDFFINENMERYKIKKLEDLKILEARKEPDFILCTKNIDVLIAYEKMAKNS